MIIRFRWRLKFDVRTNNALRVAMTTWFQQLPAIVVTLFWRDPQSSITIHICDHRHQLLRDYCRGHRRHQLFTVELIARHRLFTVEVYARHQLFTVGVFASHQLFSIYCRGLRKTPTINCRGRHQTFEDTNCRVITVELFARHQLLRDYCI